MRALTVLLVMKVVSTLSFSKLPDNFHHDIDETSVSAGFQHTCAIEATEGIRALRLNICAQL